MRARACRCGGIRQDGKCSRCGTCDKQDDRRSSNERGYDWQWRKFSERYRARNPLCVDCLTKGKTTPSTEVHHVRKLSDFPGLKYELNNLRALCSECHKTRTQAGE